MLAPGDLKLTAVWKRDNNITEEKVKHACLEAWIEPWFICCGMQML